MTLHFLPAIRARLARHARDEDGNIATFSVLLFSLMVMTGGLAVDLMRAEHTRTSLQQTVDRCTLAAAALRQTLDPSLVCRDYLIKAGLEPYLQSVTVTQSAGSRTVQAVASGRQDNIFAPLLGFETFPVPASSAATQSITDIEIVLVLDVSGSMSGAKLANLKEAAAGFVDTVTANNTDKRVSIAIVPYNAQVNMPDYLISKYNAVGPVTVANANCLEIPSAMFAVPGISTTAPIPRAVYADTANGTAGGNGYTAFDATGNSGANNAFQFCNPRNGNAATGALTQNLIFPPSSDAVALKARINALYAGGNTSITLGMKWGLNMVDPGTRPVFAQLASEGNMDADFDDRPYDYEKEDVMKIIVLMTDGEHVSHRITDDAYRGTDTNSGIWRGMDGNYSIRHASGRPAAAGTNEYWVPHRSEWRAGPWTGNDDDTGLVEEQSWTGLWQNQRMSWVAWQLYARALGTDDTTRTAAYNTAMGNFTNVYSSVANMNTSLQQSCNLARENDVIVYGIAFEAPANGQAQILACSSSSVNYYQADDKDGINSAFSSIAAQITQLRLTQ
ncbi:MAG: pilus assembly protein TadG-related protein [Paracoccaceae bacterium]